MYNILVIHPKLYSGVLDIIVTLDKAAIYKLRKALRKSKCLIPRRTCVGTKSLNDVNTKYGTTRQEKLRVISWGGGTPPHVTGVK